MYRENTQAGKPDPAIIRANTQIQKSAELLRQLLSRGDQISIEHGRLVLISASGNAVPDAWLQENEATLIEQIAAHTGIAIYRYIDYSTGRYGSHLFAGVTLQFESITTLAAAYAIFNCDLDKARNSKHGAADKPLPNKHFRLRRKHHLNKLFQRSGIKPRRLAVAHKAMYRLKELVFTASYRKGTKLINDSIAPLNLTHSNLLELLDFGGQGGDRAGTTGGQERDKKGTSNGDKESAEIVAQSDFQPFSTACDSNHVKKNYVTKEVRSQESVIPSVPSPIPSIPNSKQKRIETQSHADWLADYESDD